MVCILFYERRNNHAFQFLYFYLLPIALLDFNFLIVIFRGSVSKQAFSDYALFILFFPLLIAGPIVSRKETLCTHVNVMIIFLCSGIWHGASWNYLSFLPFSSLYSHGFQIRKKYQEHSSSRNLLFTEIFLQEPF